MYVENKLHYLRANGWEVHVFYYSYAEKILLSGLEEFRGNYLPEMQRSIKILPKYKINKVIDKIQGIVKPDGTQTIVESQLVDSALWGELISERLHARHILNILEERIPSFNDKLNINLIII